MGKRAVSWCGLSLPDKVMINEVGPRDGLQNENRFVDTDTKIKFVEGLADAGLRLIETTAFVSPKWVPQMEDAPELMRRLQKKPDIRYPVLVPNIQGYRKAIASGAEEVAIFASASETFSWRNINSGIEQSIHNYEAVCSQAKADGVPVRGYLSCVLGCPFEGRIDPVAVAQVASTLHQMGCYEISLGDTIGSGTAGSTHRMLEQVVRRVPVEEIAVHFHDTYGQALANILASLQYGINVVDSSVAGLGGCPYAKGASGNVATEDVVYMLHGMHIETGIDLDALIDVGYWISNILGREPRSAVARSLFKRRINNSIAQL